MWLKWCAFAMVVGLSCVVAGMGIAVASQLTFLGCDAGETCPLGEVQKRLAIGVSLMGVIIASLSTAAVAGLLMRDARPRHGAAPTLAASLAPPPPE